MLLITSMFAVAMHTQDVEPIVSPSDTPCTWGVRISGLVWVFCKGMYVRIRKGKIVDEACATNTRLCPATSQGLPPPLLKSGSCSSDLGEYRHSPLQLEKESVPRNRSSSKLLHCQSSPVQRRSTRVSCTSSFSQVPLSAWCSPRQTSSFGEPASVVTGMLHNALMQLQLPPSMHKKQPTGLESASFPTRQLSKGSNPSMLRTQYSASSFSASGSREQPQIPNSWYPGLDLDKTHGTNACNAGGFHQFLLQPYDEEKRTWLQVKWQQQQDWLEQQEQVNAISVSQLLQLQQGSRSLNVRNAQQSDIKLLGGEI